MHLSDRDLDVAVILAFVVRSQSSLIIIIIKLDCDPTTVFRTGPVNGQRTIFPGIM